MRLMWLHFRAMTIELLRQPSYLVPTLVFPAAFYWFFALPEANSESVANILMASFASFAVFGVVFFQFGVGIASERGSPWSLYLRSLPLPPTCYLGARALTALLFSLLTALLVVSLGVSLSPVSLDTQQWLRFGLALLMGSLPFVFMGTALGYWSSAKNALPIANLIYLPLSFAGGLWKPPQLLPESLKKLSLYLPTRHYGEVVWSTSLGQAWKLENWLWLAVYALLFLALSVWGFRRDQSQRFA